MGRILPESTAKEQRCKEHDQLGDHKRGFETRVKGGGITMIRRGHNKERWTSFCYAMGVT